ncbi:hypothetical protein D2V04_15150 [Pelagerythrobacter aerophilus]|uniref:Uncharacterized protein n=1 Tax=Pelagerythrobacter aerophilus TaxID=2306995 RepID=A0A418NDZ3_9SPHN|nr:hypothetical protein D2V04_15150 [Pelagerythrobacter aerophilus]
MRLNADKEDPKIVRTHRPALGFVVSDCVGFRCAILHADQVTTHGNEGLCFHFERIEALV